MSNFQTDFSEYPGLYSIDQVIDIDTERLGNAFQDQRRRIAHASLDPADVAAIEPPVGDKNFLRDRALMAQPTKVRVAMRPRARSCRRSVTVKNVRLTIYRDIDWVRL